MLIRRSPLDPLPRLRPPRPSTLVRTGLVAALLCLAAAALYVEPAPAPAAGPALPSAAARPGLPDGLVGVPVRLAEPVAIAALRPGDRVDLLTLPDGATVASAALVLVTAGDADAPVLVLALSEAQAHGVVAAGPQARFGVILRHREAG